ncbi:hairy-related 5 [Parambassis ranga]|uniref:Hairy-related 5 n=1 Tax=Parambassis ranga TaxID=210632 RepID=A0A6P7J7F3_9TELE|nr:transcription factor HES-7.1-B-like [Parambassis ranga]
MKVLTSAQTPRQAMRRVTKPVMEKRRRERINHSLEMLRLLMVESTNNEKLNNPKVEKAEILESVVEFLKKDKARERGHQAVTRVLSREQRQSCAPQKNYRGGMRSCLLRVGHFVASKSQQLETGGDLDQASFTHTEPRTHSASFGLMLPSPPPGDLAALTPHHLQHHHHHQLSPPYLTERTSFHCSSTLLSPSTGVSTHITDPVWRPWPQ